MTLQESSDAIVLVDLYGSAPRAIPGPCHIHAQMRRGKVTAEYTADTHRNTSGTPGSRPGRGSSRGQAGQLLSSPVRHVSRPSAVQETGCTHDTPRSPTCDARADDEVEALLVVLLLVACVVRTSTR